MRGPIDFTSAQFSRGVSFAETQFSTEALFDRAQFGSITSFAGASTNGLRMGRVMFAGPAIFRQHKFHSNADFTGATFQQQADFTLAKFDKDALFDSASFDHGASFRLTTALYASFRRAQARGPLIFDGAGFRKGASLANVSAFDLLSLRSFRMPAQTGLELDQLSASTLLIDVPTVDRVRGVTVQQEVLSKPEKSAEVTGDLALANDARFHRLTLQASQNGFAYQVFDYIVLREIAGYLVRPIYPLRALVFVLVLGVIVRTVPKWGKKTRLPQLFLARRWTTSTPRLAPRAEPSHRAFITSLWASTHNIVAKRPRIEWKDEEVPSGPIVALRGEFFAYKILIVLFLLGLGNSNPTVRQVIDAIVR